MTKELFVTLDCFPFDALPGRDRRREKQQGFEKSQVQERHGRRNAPSRLRFGGTRKRRAFLDGGPVCGAIFEKASQQKN